MGLQIHAAVWPCQGAWISVGSSAGRHWKDRKKGDWCVQKLPRAAVENPLRRWEELATVKPGRPGSRSRYKVLTFGIQVVVLKHGHKIDTPPIKGWVLCAVPA